mgnify:CR=1 FL=1
MNQPFCSPVQALRSVLDAAALLPSPSPETIPLEAAREDGATVFRGAYVAPRQADLVWAHCRRRSLRPDGPTPL